MKNRPVEGQAPLTQNPFSGLAARRDDLPPGPAGAERAFIPPAPAGGAPAPERAVLRLERKGRGGKDATRVERLGLPRGELEAWLADLKAALGCGGAIEGEELVLQGDQRGRLPALLAARGVRKVTSG